MRRRDVLIGALAASGCAASPTAAAPSDFTALRWATAADGVRIAYRDSGGAGRPVLFCSGGGQAMAVWTSIADPLSKTRRVILHDRRGNGDSDPGAPESHSF